MQQNGTWNLVNLPDGKKVVGCKWVFKHKRGANGNIQWYKARLVAQGYSQKYGINYNEVFTPVAKYNSLHTVFAIVNELYLDIHQMDVKTAFLNGDPGGEIYMQQPDGFVDKDHPEMVCRLRKSLYGLKQAARCWNKAIDELFKNSGYFESDADPCIYYKRVEESFVIAAVYVNDFLIASNDTELLTLKRKRLRKRFDMEDQGKDHYWFSLSSKQNRKQGVLTINQGACLTSALKRFGMSDCKPVATPTEPGKRFNKIAGDEDPVNITEYHSAIGCLIYASIATRPDLPSAVGALSQHMLKLGKEHWIGVKRIFRYI